MFLHDARASIALQKNPLLSVTESTSSLPASRALFLAGSAAEWKSIYLSQISSSTGTSLKLLDVIQDITILENIHTEVDVSLCYTAILYGFWSQIWAFRESWKFHAIAENADSVHRLWITTQQRELRCEIERFKDILLSVKTLEAELILTAQLLMMILHVSPEELQRFAGKSGEDAANEAFVTLERWSNTEQSRRAVWHAAQVFRWASVLPATELRDFYAIAVYFAALTMWTYGHLSAYPARNSSKAAKSMDQPSASQDSSSMVIINCDESPKTCAFIAGRNDRPALSTVIFKPEIEKDDTNSEMVIMLSDPNAVLKLARDLYRRNFPFHDGPLPPLVENMGNLMRDLGSLPDNRFSRCVSPIE